MAGNKMCFEFLLKTYKMVWGWAGPGEMTQQLRAFVALAEDPTSVPRNHIHLAHNQQAGNLALRDLTPASGLFKHAQLHHTLI